MRVTKKTIGGIGAALGAAAALALPLIEVWEGLRTRPYRDPVGIATVCYGQTGVEMRPYSPEECKAMLNRAIIGRYGPEVIKCTPGIGEYPGAFAAAISLAYNIGPTAYCKSTAARRFREGRLSEGCDAFALWVRAGGRVLPGLINRREAEIEMCQGAVAGSETRG
jgi:lysozyme